MAGVLDAELASRRGGSSIGAEHADLAQRRSRVVGDRERKGVGR